MRVLILLALVLSVASTPGDGQPQRIRLEPGAKIYIFPKAVKDDVRVCVEVGDKQLACVTAQHLRERFALADRADRIR